VWTATGQRVQRLLDVPRRELPELDITEPFSERLDGVPVELLGPVGPAAQPVRQPVVQRRADGVRRAGPDAAVQVAPQGPELGLDFRLRPALHLPADALPSLEAEGDGSDPVRLALGLALTRKGEISRQAPYRPLPGEIWWAN